MSVRADRRGATAKAERAGAARPDRAKRLDPSDMRVQRKRGKGSAKTLQSDEGESGKQVVRLLNILRALEGARHGLTAREVLDQLELDCGIRTVYRSLGQLEAVFPLVKEGPRWRIDDKALAAEPLQPSQALALLVVEDLLQPLAGHEVVEVIRSLRSSVRARLKPDGRAWVDEFRRTLALTLQAPVHGVDPKLLEKAGEACIQEQCLHISYAAPNKRPESRIVEPHLVWKSGGKAYLVAYCRKAEGFRTFAVQRIRRADLLDEEFDRRADFDESEYVTRGFGVLHGPVHEVTVHFTASVAHLARERLWHPTQQIAELPDGSCDVHLRAAGILEIAAWIASFGGKLRAVSPPELVDAVRDLHAAGLEAHEAANSARPPRSGKRAPSTGQRARA